VAHSVAVLVRPSHARLRARGRRVDLAGSGASPADVLVRSGASVRRRPAPRHRDRRRGRRDGACARVGHRQLRRLGADERADAHDPDSVRPCGQSHASRLDRGRGACERRRGHCGRHRRPEWHGRVRRALCAPRHSRRLERSGLPRSARVPARARAAGSGLRACPGADSRARSGACPRARSGSAPRRGSGRSARCTAGRATGRAARRATGRAGGAGRDACGAASGCHGRARCRPAACGARGRRTAQHSGAHRAGAHRCPRRRLGAAREVDRAVAPVRTGRPGGGCPASGHIAGPARYRKSGDCRAGCRPGSESCRRTAGRRLDRDLVPGWAYECVGRRGPKHLWRIAGVRAWPARSSASNLCARSTAGGPRPVGARSRSGLPRGRSYDL
jgi:hypothetical protein